MAAVPCVINGVIVDLYGRTIMGPVKIMGEFIRSDVGVGGGPIIPEPKPPLPPLGIWPGPGDPDFPGGPHPAHPIVLPGDPGWEGPGGIKPPDFTVPPPGSPPVVLPGLKPVHPIVAPPFIVVDYPGVGKVLVPQPVATEPVK